MANAFEDVEVRTGMELAVQQSSQAVSAVANSDQARAVAEVQAALVIAKSQPRNEMRSRERILQACQRTSLAQGAIYSYPRGGQQVSGPSIRLAEVAARSWGNMTYGFRELSRRVGESEVEAWAWDLETNTKAVRQFAVRHARDKGNSSVAVSQERDIYEVIANQAQRRVRSCILEIVPGDIIEEAVETCERTVKAAVGGGSPSELAKVVKDMAEAYERIGVPREAIEKRLGHRLDATQAGEVIGLRKIFASIRDGFSLPADWFALEAKEETKPEPEKSKKGKEPKPAVQPSGTICPEGGPMYNPSGIPVDEKYCQEQCKSRDGCPSWEGGAE